MRRMLSSAAVCLLAVGILAGGAVWADGPHWEYSGTEGPEHWGTLDPSFAACSTGKTQSPIDVANPVDVDLKPITFAYAGGGNEIVNNGHTVQVNFKAGSSITLDGRTYELKQFHFHTPSENHIRGKSFPLEVHLVHADAAGHLAVVGVMFEDGPASAALAALWSQMPKAVNTPQALSAAISADGLLPKDRDYYTFQGSLTTPPCSEGVRWLLLKHSATASKAQVDALLKTLGHANNRPLQAANGRVEQE